MPATLPNIRLAGNIWHDFNTLSGIAAGIAVEAQNIGTTDLYYSISATQPPLGDAETDSRYRIWRRGEVIRTAGSDPTLWIKSDHSEGLINASPYVDPLVPTQTGYGEALAQGLTPISQILAPYGLVDGEVFTLQEDGGLAFAEDSNFVVSSGSDPAGFSTLTALRLAQYRPGLGLRCRISALFETGGRVDGQYAAGIFTQEDGLLFGFINETFGIIHYFAGSPESQRLTLTTPAAGAENATVTINGTPFIVPLTAGTLAHNAFEIAAALDGVVPGYFITANQATVVAQSTIPGPATGAFAFTSATAVGAWAQLNAGALPIINFIPQTAWNRDLAAWLDTTRGNVYQIVPQYLGYGAIDFYIEEPVSGKMVLVHRIEYANANVIPSIGNPAYFVGWIARNFGNTDPLIVKGASAAAFIEGKMHRNGPTLTQNGEALSVGTSATTVIILRIRRHFNGRTNLRSILPLEMFVSSQTSKAAFFELVKNPTLSGEVIFSYKDEPNSVVEFSTQNVAASGGTSIAAATASLGDSHALRFNTSDDFSTFFGPGDVIAVTARVNIAPAADMQATFTWQED